MTKVMHILCLIILFWNILPDAEAQYYKCLNDIFTSPVSSFFGFNEGYCPKNSITRYRIVEPTSDNTDDLTQAWFDVSNNNITCSINANGLVEYPSVLGPLAGYDQGRGNKNFKEYNFDEYITGSQWTFSINDGDKSSLFSNIKNPSLEIVDNIFYKWKYKYDNLRIQLLLFAPEGEENPRIPEPRALIAVIHLENTGTGSINGTISVSGSIRDANKIDSSLKKAVLYGPAAKPLADSHRGDSSNFHPRYAEVAPTIAGYEAVLSLDSTSWKPGSTDVSFLLTPGSNTNLAFAFIVGGGISELKHTRDFVSSKSVLDWLNSTAYLHKRAVGNLTVPEDLMLAEMFYRYYECGHTCYLLNGNGVLTEPKGGSWSIMSLLNPSYVAGSMNNLNYLSGMIPFYRQSVKSNVSFSLYGSTLELIMATDYYQRAGDTDYFKNRIFQKNTTEIINKILLTEYPEATLFPSRNIWDGPSRGDYHTGSQILVWRVLDVFSRIALEIWNDTISANHWARKALACKSDILSKCTIPGPFGRQFAEGAFKNGAVDSAARCHDGEEVAVVQSAFYGLTEPDNPLVINHCRASMTPFNYLYNKSLNAMMWQSSSYWNGGYTFPAWLVLLAGAVNHDQLLSGIHQWKSMTDIDGSPWWWPYDVCQTDPLIVNRRRCNFTGGFCDVAKVSYTTSVFNTLLINNILGLSANVPQKTVSFIPFSPWSSFEWSGGRIGNAFFDITYSDDGSSVAASITNRNTETYSGIIGITAPEGKTIQGKNAEGKRYGRDYIKTEKSLKPGEKVTFKIYYK